MSKYPPFIRRNSGDIVTSDDWNHLQELIREEVRQHRHEGETGDTNQLGRLGTQLDNASLAEGAVDEAAFADGAVTASALQNATFGDASVAAEAAILEADNLVFDPEDGHDHDGVNSSALAENSVGTEQLTDGAVRLDKLAPELLDEIADLEQLLAIPQALSVGSAPGSVGNAQSFVDIVGHGFGDQPGAVRLLKLQPSKPGEYSDAGLLTIDDWSNNKVRVLLPEDPTGLLQVEVDGLALNPLPFEEALVVVGSAPEHRQLDASHDLAIHVEFSTELLLDSTPGDPVDGPPLMVLFPGENTPRALIQDADGDVDPPWPDRPVELFYGEQAERLDALLQISSDRKTITLVPNLPELPFDTPFTIRIYGSEEGGVKPLLVAANSSQPITGPVTEILFTTQKKPPAPPERVTIVEVIGKGGRQVSPPNTINAANQHAVPIEIKTHPTALPSEWIVVEMTDGKTTVSEQIPAIGGGETVRATLDARGLEDGPVEVMAQARNSTSASEWRDIQAIDPRTGSAVDWVAKDTRPPFLRVHPVRTPTSRDTQAIDVETEPGSTITIIGGARPVSQTDTGWRGRLSLTVPLNPNTANNLRVFGFDSAGNPSHLVATDREKKPLVIVHDDTLPELRVDPVATPTRNRHLVVRGRANEPVTVVATLHGRIFTGTADIDTPFAIPLQLARNSANDIRLVATDTSGNTSVPIQLLVVHDDNPPPLRLVNKGYHRFYNVSSSRPHIVVRSHRATIAGYTEAGARVTLSGHGHFISTTAKSDGSFAIAIPFALRPKSIHNRVETRNWYFNLDATDRAGNRTNQRREIRLSLDYRIPDPVCQEFLDVRHVKARWLTKFKPHYRGRSWFHDGARNRVISYCVKLPPKPLPQLIAQTLPVRKPKPPPPRPAREFRHDFGESVKKNHSRPTAGGARLDAVRENLRLE